MKLIEITMEEFRNTLYKQYVELFPSNERRAAKKMEHTYLIGVEKYYKITKDNKLLGFIILEKLPSMPYYLDYFAILKNEQKKGYGTQAMKLLLKEICKDDGVCLEVEKIDENNLITQKRARFYETLGFEQVASQYSLYGVLYTPYIYNPKKHLNKEQIDNVFLNYYNVNVGQAATKKNCKIIY